VNRLKQFIYLILTSFSCICSAEPTEVSPINVQTVVDEMNVQQNIDAITDYYKEVDKALNRNRSKKTDQTQTASSAESQTQQPENTQVVSPSDPKLDAFIDSLSDQGEVPFNPDGLPRSRYRDPFALTQRMIDEANLNSGQKPTEFIQQAVTRLNIPDIALKGIVETVDGSRAAMIGIGPKRTYVVRETDSVSLSEFKQDTVLFIKEINRLSVVIEVGSLGQSIILR
jgi:hypothetical protein